MINQYDDTSLVEILTFLTNESIKGMLIDAKKRQPAHLKLLENFVILDPLMTAYDQNVIFGVREMCNFADIYQLPYNRQGIVATLHINHALKIAFGFIDELKTLTDYSKQGEKFNIFYTITATYFNMESIVNWVTSAIKYSDLSPSAPFSVYANRQIKYISERLTTEALNSITQYEENMVLCELPRESTEFLQALRDFVLANKFEINFGGILNSTEITSIHTNGERVFGFQIGIFNSQNTTPSFRRSVYQKECFIQSKGGIYEFDENIFQNKIREFYESKFDENKFNAAENDINLKSTKATSDVAVETFINIEENGFEKSQTNVNKNDLKISNLDKTINVNTDLSPSTKLIQTERNIISNAGPSRQNQISPSNPAQLENEAGPNEIPLHAISNPGSTDSRHISPRPTDSECTSPGSIDSGRTSESEMHLPSDSIEPAIQTELSGASQASGFSNQSGASDIESSDVGSNAEAASSSTASLNPEFEFPQS